MKNVIKSWCSDHQISLPDDRIEMLEVMIRTKESEKVSILEELGKWFTKNRFKEVEMTYSDTAFVIRVENKNEKNE